MRRNDHRDLYRAELLARPNERMQEAKDRLVTSRRAPGRSR
jgi:hypothetical protein